MSYIIEKRIEQLVEEAHAKLEEARLLADKFDVPFTYELEADIGASAL